MQALCVPRDLCQFSPCPGTKENTLVALLYPQPAPLSWQWVAAVTPASVACNSAIPQGTLSRVDFSFFFSWFNFLSPFILCYVQQGPAWLCLRNQEVRGCNLEWFLFKEMENHVFWDIWDFEIIWWTGNQFSASYIPALKLNFEGTAFFNTTRSKWRLSLHLLRLLYKR